MKSILKFSLFKVRNGKGDFFFFPSWFLEAETNGEYIFSVSKGEQKWADGETQGLVGGRL